MVRSLILFAGIAAASMPQTANPAAEAARVQDVYAVYSTLMANPPVIGGDANKTYAIAATTTPASLEFAANPGLAASPIAPEAVLVLGAKCDAPPPAYEDRWQEILSDFRSRSDVPVPLLHELKIAKPYLFLTPEDVALFMSAHNTIKAPVLPNPQFGGAVAVISLSNVYFNKDRTLAVVRISSQCGALCGQGERMIYEKSSTGWREVTGGLRCVKYS